LQEQQKAARIKEQPTLEQQKNMMRMQNANKQQQRRQMEQQQQKHPELIVSAENDKLVFHTEVLKSFVKSKKIENIPIAVIAIIGEPYTNKSFIANSIIRFNEALSDDLDWISEAIEDSTCEGTLKSNHGITIRSVPNLFGTKTRRPVAAVVLDIIVTENVRDDIYIKLVDFCVASSSIVIYSANVFIEDIQVN